MGLEQCPYRNRATKGDAVIGKSDIRHQTADLRRWTERQKGLRLPKREENPEIRGEFYSMFVRGLS